MKKVLLFSILTLTLTACQSPSSKLVYQATGPTQCQELEDSFRCMTPLAVWHESLYPKNNHQKRITPSVVVPYQEESLSQAVYGTY